MRKFFPIQIIIVVLIMQSLTAQPFRETRAVWLSTNYRLDWPPPTFDQRVQKEALIKILDDIESKNLNTVYFQVRSNGSTLFNSSYEPFSPYITGIVDVSGDYDPLEFAITEAHKRGLEIHAWINTMRCFNTSDLTILEHPKHIVSTHPYWVYRKEETEGYSFWINPGIPEVREYLIDLINELVERYDVDGVQLDFIRYPQEPIDDIDSYNIYGNGKNIDDWRRENINLFVGMLSDRIKRTNPRIKLGVTPIGIYQNIVNARGLQGFSEVFQDSRDWLKNGDIDYVVPQIYWNIENNPQFPILVEDWTKSSYGKSVVIGLAAYREEIANEIDQEIEITRSANADGTAIYRYKHLHDLSIKSFAEKTLPVKMSWITTYPQLPSISSTISKSDTQSDHLTLKWELPQYGHNEVKYVSIYEIVSDENDSRQKLLKVIGSQITSATIPISTLNRSVNSYVVKSLDGLWNESEQYEIISYQIPELAKIYDELSKFDKPFLVKLQGKFHLIVNSSSREKLNVKASSKDQDLILIETQDLKSGLNSIRVSKELLNNEKVILEFVNSGRVVELNN